MLESSNKVADPKACKETPTQLFSRTMRNFYEQLFYRTSSLAASAVLENS